MDPCELRLKNAAQPMDPDPTGGMNLGNARIEDCIRTGMEAFNWKERRAKVREKIRTGMHGASEWHAEPTETDTRVHTLSSRMCR